MVEQNVMDGLMDGLTKRIVNVAGPEEIFFDSATRRCMNVPKAAGEW